MPSATTAIVLTNPGTGAIAVLGTELSFRKYSPLFSEIQFSCVEKCRVARRSNASVQAEGAHKCDRFSVAFSINTRGFDLRYAKASRPIEGRPSLRPFFHCACKTAKWELDTSGTPMLLFLSCCCAWQDGRRLTRRRLQNLIGVTAALVDAIEGQPGDRVDLVVASSFVLLAHAASRRTATTWRRSCNAVSCR